MGLLNRKMGEIMQLRIEIERRESDVRARKVARRMARGRHT